MLDYFSLSKDLVQLPHLLQVWLLYLPSTLSLYHFHFISLYLYMYCIQYNLYILAYRVPWLSVLYIRNNFITLLITLTPLIQRNSMQHGFHIKDSFYGCPVHMPSFYLIIRMPLILILIRLIWVVTWCSD